MNNIVTSFNENKECFICKKNDSNINQFNDDYLYDCNFCISDKLRLVETYIALYKVFISLYNNQSIFYDMLKNETTVYDNNMFVLCTFIGFPDLNNFEEKINKYILIS